MLYSLKSQLRCSFFVFSLFYFILAKRRRFWKSILVINLKGNRNQIEVSSRGLYIPHCTVFLMEMDMMMSAFFFYFAERQIGNFLDLSFFFSYITSSKLFIYYSFGFCLFSCPLCGGDIGGGKISRKASKTRGTGPGGQVVVWDSVQSSKKQKNVKKEKQ